MLEIRFTGAEVLRPGGFETGPLTICEGVISDGAARRDVDCSGLKILPGMVDLHGDGFERHVAPRRGAMKNLGEGILAAEAEMAANGITTGILAQFMSWEGSVRGPEFAATIFEAIRDAETITDLWAQLRLEMNMLELYEALPSQVAQWQIPYVVFNDHLPHKRLAEGRRPKAMTGQALRAGRSPDKHFELLMELHARSSQVPAALDTLCPKLIAQGVMLGSHDDNTAAQRAAWMARGVTIAEFPETLEAAETNGSVILGSPNVVRGGSHKGNMSALDAVIMGYGDALASDYHYPSLRRAALFLAKTIGFATAWDLVSAGPARVLGLKDRGQLKTGLRADIVILDPQNQVTGTISGGRFSFVNGVLAERLCA